MVYPFEIMFSIAEDEGQFRKHLDKFGAEYDESLALHGHVVGRATLLSCNRSVIRLVRFPSTPNDHGILAHEIFHIVDFLLGRIGLTLTDSSGEAYAYLLGYITEQIYRHLKHLK